METIEHSGVWWLPENPNFQISGILKYNPKEGACLELIGTFKGIDDLSGIINKELSAPTIILGVTVSGKSITLYKCFEKSFSLSFPGLPKSVFYVNVIFIGCHFKKEEEILLDDISISYSNLEEWIGISGFKQDTEIDQNGHIKKIAYTYEPPKAIVAKLENYDININFNFGSHSDLTYSFDLKQTIFINIKPPKPLGFRVYLDGIMENIRDFLSLAIGKAIYPRTIIGKSKDSVTKLANGEIVLNDIQIFTRAGIFVDYSAKVHQHEMLFTFRDIADYFTIYLKNWIDKSSLLCPVYELYFGTFYNPSMYRNHEFLSLAQALESYHRRTSGGKYVSDEDFRSQYDAFLNAIENSLDPDFKESLRNKMKYLNDFSLRKRLKIILGQCGDWITLFIKSPDLFIEDVCNTRNYLTHYDEQLESQVKKGQSLNWLVQKMKFVIEICFLSELGMPVENVKTLLARNQKYKDLVSH